MIDRCNGCGFVDGGFIFHLDAMEAREEPLLFDPLLLHHYIKIQMK